MAQSLDFNEIKSSCINLTNLATSFDGTINEVDSAVGKIKDPTWAGDAASNFRTEITNLTKNLPDAKEQLALSVLFLAGCADGYSALGEANVAKLKELIGGQEAIDNTDVSSLPEVDLSTVSNDANVNNADVNNADDINSYGNSNPYSSGGNSSGGEYDAGDLYYTAGNEALAGTVAAAATASLLSIVNLTTNEFTNKEVSVPDDIIQTGYACAGYDYNLQSGAQVTFEDNTSEKIVQQVWQEQNARFKNGMAVINVNGMDRYLIATTSQYGKIGDCVDVTLKNGTVVPCIIANHKDKKEGSDYEFVQNDASSIIEFQVERAKYLTSGIPTTSSWQLPWDSSSPVSKMKDIGSILGAQEVVTSSFTGATTTNGNNTNTNTNTNKNINII